MRLFPEVIHRKTGNRRSLGDVDETTILNGISRTAVARFEIASYNLHG
jgi:hypothetical protein